ncbi:MAG: hypothetical protein QXN05_02625 [Acidilobaceae archaeon]
MSDKRKCLMCGRVFPEGQGVIISRGGLILEFHSSRCAYKFFKIFFERLDYQCLTVARDLAGELAKREAKPVKKI